MIVLLLVGFLGGLVTGISPCILPVLPVIFAAGAASGLDDERPIEAQTPVPVLVTAGAGSAGAAESHRRGRPVVDRDVSEPDGPNDGRSRRRATLPPAQAPVRGGGRTGAELLGGHPDRVVVAQRPRACPRTCCGGSAWWSSAWSGWA